MQEFTTDQVKENVSRYFQCDNWQEFILKYDEGFCNRALNDYIVYFEVKIIE